MQDFTKGPGGGPPAAGWPVGLSWNDFLARTFAGGGAIFLLSAAVAFSALESENLPARFFTGHTVGPVILFTIFIGLLAGVAPGRHRQCNLVIAPFLAAGLAWFGLFLTGQFSEDGPKLLFRIALIIGLGLAVTGLVLYFKPGLAATKVYFLILPLAGLNFLIFVGYRPMVGTVLSVLLLLGPPLCLRALREELFSEKGGSAPAQPDCAPGYLALRLPIYLMAHVLAMVAINVAYGLGGGPPSMPVSYRPIYFSLWRLSGVIQKNSGPGMTGNVNDLII